MAENKHAWTVEEFQKGDAALVENLNNLEEQAGSGVKKNPQKFPNSSHVVTQSDIDAGIYDKEFKGANWIHGTLYSYCYVDGTPMEYSKWLVVGNDPATNTKAFNHSIPERDAYGRLFTLCSDRTYATELENEVTNVGAVKYLISKKTPDIESTAEDGTYVLKATKSGSTITYQWVKE